jgi:cytochrome c556
MRIATLILAASTLSLTAAAVARPADTPMKAPDHAAVIQARQAGFKLSVASFLAIKIGIGRGDDAHLYALPANALAAWGKAIPTMFPPGSDGATSNALPTVWSDRAGFEAAAATMSAAAAKLAELSKAGDAPGVAAQWDVLKGSCSDCHTKYRKAEEKH